MNLNVSRQLQAKHVLIRLVRISVGAGSLLIAGILFYNFISWWAYITLNIKNISVSEILKSLLFFYPLYLPIGIFLGGLGLISLKRWGAILALWAYSFSVVFVVLAYILLSALTSH